MKIPVAFEPERSAETVEVRSGTIYDGRLFWPVALAILAAALWLGWAAVN